MSYRSYLQGRVDEWHGLIGSDPAPELPTSLTQEQRDLHARVCLEEFAELGVALVGADRALDLFERLLNKVVLKRGHESPGELPEIVDACVDSMYVATGTMWRAGVRDGIYIEEVCNSNDSKAGGGRDEHGKFLKGPNFRHPDIEGLLIRQGWKR